jgi:hypothetical protein
MEQANELTGREKMMTRILARDGGLMQTTNGAGQKIWCLTEAVQDFVDENYESLIKGAKN